MKAIKITLNKHIERAITKGAVLCYSVGKMKKSIINVIEEHKKISEKEHQIELADAQILGFQHKQSGGDLITLIEAMGLTIIEWNKLKKYKHTSLSKAEKTMITKNFKKDGK